MREKTVQQALSLIENTNAWHLWRQVPPDHLFSSHPIRQEVRERSISALKAGTRFFPELTTIVEGIKEGCHESLFKFLLGLPASLPNGQVAWFDIRMTAVLSAGLTGTDTTDLLFPEFWYCTDGGRWKTGLPGNPFAAGMICRGLILYANFLPEPSPVTKSTPKRDRTQEEALQVAAWKRERSRLYGAALSWMMFDPLASVFDLSPTRTDLFSIRELAEVLDKVSKFCGWGDTRKVTESSIEGKTAEIRKFGDRATTREVVEASPTRKAPEFLVFREELKLKGELAKQGWERMTSPLPLLGEETGDLADRLTREFPWMSDAIQHVRLDLNLLRLADGSTSFLKLRPFLLVGPPGTGKTRFARRMAKLAGIPIRIVSCSGSSDNRDLEGTARGWASAEPSAVLRAMREGSCANPVLLVDEVEKAGQSRHNGRIIDTLLTMLEPESAVAWYDQCLCTTADLTAVNWILTANDLSGLPEPLLNRLRIINVPMPPVELLPQILDSLTEEIAREMGVDPFALPEILPEVRTALHEAFSRGASIRRIKAALLSAIGASLSIPRTLH